MATNAQAALLAAVEIGARNDVKPDGICLDANVFKAWLDEQDKADRVAAQAMGAATDRLRGQDISG